MKKLMICSVLIATFFFGCKTQQKSTGYTYDDVYSNGSDPAKVTSKPKIQNKDISTSSTVAVTDTSSVKAKAAASSPIDYSDNSYSARIKRFNDKNPGLDYSSEYYTKSTDSTSSGGSPNVNLYLGSTWGSPFWDPYYSFGWGYGWGDFGFGFGYPYYWGYPYYGYSYWGYPYWGGGWGWHHHYWDWNYNNNNYYGQRTVPSPNGGQNARATSNNDLKTTPTKNSRTSNPGNISHPTDQTTSGRANVNRISPDQQHYSYVRSNTKGNAGSTRNIQYNQTGSSRTYIQHQQPAPRYVRPGSQPQTGRPNAQVYSSPAYRQPKSSREYINPQPQQNRSGGVGEASGRNGNYSNPNSGRRYSSPAYTGGNSRVYSNPSGSSRFYNTPSRSYSSGGYGSPRSSGSGFSAPSHSSSAPSHSGGGGGGGHSGGGGHR